MNILTGEIISYDGEYLTVKPSIPIARELMKKQSESVELRLNDNRSISAEQRKKIFALIRDISSWNGDVPEYIRACMQFDFEIKNELGPFSLSNCDMTTAKEFINYLIDFCFEWNVPTRDSLLNRTDDINRYLYLCLEHRKCAVCNAKADVHHVTAVGMGRNRDEIIHIGMEAVALCRKHHNQAHAEGSRFFERYHIYGIKLDKYLCDVLNLRTKKKERKDND